MRAHLDFHQLDKLKKVCFIQSDQELAELSGISPETLSRLRHGRTPKLKTIEQICNALNKRLLLIPQNRDEKKLKPKDLLA